MNLNAYERIPKKYLGLKAINPNFSDHNLAIPFRMAIVAPSGSGKSNFCFNLIEKFSSGQGTFSSINIICKSKENEPLYLCLQENGVKVSDGLHNLPYLSNEKFNKTLNHLIVIDDMQGENKADQNAIVDYYIRCRKFNVSIIYLAQNYFCIPKTIRDNCNYLVILKINSKRDLPLIVSDCGSLNIDKDCLLKMYSYATTEKFSSFIIDKETSDISHKFRKNFLEYLNPEEFK